MSKSNNQSVFITKSIISNRTSSTELDSHKNITNSSAHTISNIVGLQSILDSKEDTIENGVTGDYTVVVGPTLSDTQTFSFTNGILTGVV